MNYSESANGLGINFRVEVDPLVKPVFVPFEFLSYDDFGEPIFPNSHKAKMEDEIFKREEQAAEIRKKRKEQQEKERLDLQKKETPPPQDEQIDMFGDSIKESPTSPYTPGGKIASSKKDKIPGGLADKKSPSDFNQKDLKRGIKVELEHTSDRDIAQEIAMDHLTEDSKYYQKLEKMEKRQSSRYWYRTSSFKKRLSQCVDMCESKFENEKDNKIRVKVEKKDSKDKDLDKEIVVIVEGPKSISENIITEMEAKELKGCLNTVLSKNNFWYKISQRSFDFETQKSWEINDPFKDDEEYYVYHGFADTADAWNTLKKGLSGSEKVPRKYSYESQNNPMGLFVTLNRKTAQEFSSTHGESVIFELLVSGKDLESPVWPSGSYTVQGQMAEYWKGDTFEEQMQDRENSRMENVERQKKELEERKIDLERRIERDRASLEEWNSIENIPEESLSSIERTKDWLNSSEKELAHINALLSSDRIDLAKSLVGGEQQALFVGDIDPSDVKSVWVRVENKEKGYMLTTDPFVQMSPEDFMNKFEEKTNERTNDLESKAFSPKEDFDPDIFWERVPKYVHRDKQRSINVFSEHPEYYRMYFWPRQIPAAKEYFERNRSVDKNAYSNHWYKWSNENQYV